MSSPLASASALIAASEGQPIESIHRETGVDGDSLVDFDASVSDVFLPKIVSLLERVRGSNQALALGKRLPLSACGPHWGILRRAPTLAALLRLGCFSTKLIANALRSDCELEQECWYSTHHPNDATDCGIGAEIGMVLALRMGRKLFHDDIGMRVEFRHEPRGPIADYTQALGVDVVFEAASNRVYFDSKMLEAVNRCHTVEAEHLLHGQLRVLMMDRGILTDDLLAEVRTAVAANGDRRMYAPDELARSLGVSLRVLQRRVKAAGTSVSTLIDEYRFSKAKVLLLHPRHSLIDIAELVGFESERGFRRAFQRWSGMNVVSWRAHTRSET